MYELYVFPMIAHFKKYLNLPSITLNMTSYCSVICLPRYVDIYIDYSVDMCRAWYVYSDDMSTYDGYFGGGFWMIWSNTIFLGAADFKDTK